MSIIKSTDEYLKLPRLVSDGMILQRGRRIRIWGWAAAGDKITIEFKGETYKTTTDRDGDWEVFLPPMSEGGPFTMDVRGAKHISINNILVGDVWICSGQSNMVMLMDRVKYRYPEEVAQAYNPSIRQFPVPEKFDLKEEGRDVRSEGWEAVSPESILRFTAVGYFFAKKIFEKYQVPIGLITSCIGGSAIQAWLSEEALEDFPGYLKTVEKYRSGNYIDRIVKEDQAVSERWHERLSQMDKGLNGELPWFDTDYDASAWPVMKLPAFWDEGGPGKINGVAWFRKEINIPVSMTGKPARIWLGRIVDCDTVYINGLEIGSILYQYPPRIYDIDCGLLKEGQNTIVVKVTSVTGRGGFIKDKPYRLSAGEDVIDLTGEWQYKIGAVSDPLPDALWLPSLPLGLYNGMISPLINYTIKGIAWYQGESNVDNPGNYYDLFARLIADWRVKWAQGDFPFLYVQLAGFMDKDEEPPESNWSLIREAQLKVLTHRNTAMAVAFDLGEWNDIHPLNKRDVGNRLALAALKEAYGENEIVFSGPVYKSMEISGKKIIITFTNTGGGLVIKEGNALRHFTIASVDKKFIPAVAVIKGEQVEVWNDTITEPVAVRYAWADNPEGANLYNKEGLPASPFRTGE